MLTSLFVLLFIGCIGCFAGVKSMPVIVPSTTAVAPRVKDVPRRRFRRFIPRRPLLRLRSASFWARSVQIYSSYKYRQLRSRFSRRPQDLNATHEINSDRMMELCLNLRGFYLKSGQFLASRRDFMPQTYTRKLAKLHDDVPPLPAETVKIILERELGGHLDNFFTSIDLTKPIGAASIAQVHKAVWRKTGEKVAVKVQYPGADNLMRGDLANLNRLARFLRTTELKIDLLSAIKELQKQIKNEFDFIGEARNMDTIREKLLSRVPEVKLPRSIFATKTVLVMTFVEGDNLSKLAEYKSISSLGSNNFTKKVIGKRLLDVLAKAWGTMIFELREFNGDPHPGNICLPLFSLTSFNPFAAAKIGLLDWGQVKVVSPQLALDFSNLVLALQSREEDRIASTLFQIGVRVSNPADTKSIKALALTMLDTGRSQYNADPFDPNNSLKSQTVTKLPSDLYFLVRTVQLMRGIAFAFDLDYSLADKWAPYAKEVIKSSPTGPMPSSTQ